VQGQRTGQSRPSETGMANKVLGRNFTWKPRPEGILPGSQGQNLAMAVFYVPYSLVSGSGQAVMIPHADSLSLSLFLSLSIFLVLFLSLEGELRERERAYINPIGAN